MFDYMKISHQYIITLFCVSVRDRVSKMAAPPPLYKLFPLGPSAAQTSLDALVSAMWRRLFLGQDFGQNHWLNKIFAKMSEWPELATLQLCPYYFDQVTYRLPTRDQVKHKWVALLTLLHRVMFRGGSQTLMDQSLGCARRLHGSF